MDVAWDPGADAWFAGFTSGEGCFVLLREPARNRVQPQFVIGLRLDDLVILERLCEAFGGTIRTQNSRDSRSKPAAQWRVTRKHDLAGLVSYFDRFPLRAKKARDYAVWRRAVQLYLKHGWRAPGLVALAEAIKDVRRFDYEGTPPEVRGDRSQLTLILGDAERCPRSVA